VEKSRRGGTTLAAAADGTPAYEFIIFITPESLTRDIHNQYLGNAFSWGIMGRERAVIKFIAGPY